MEDTGIGYVEEIQMKNNSRTWSSIDPKYRSKPTWFTAWWLTHIYLLKKMFLLCENGKHEREKRKN